MQSDFINRIGITIYFFLIWKKSLTKTQDVQCYLRCTLEYTLPHICTLVIISTYVADVYIWQQVDKARETNTVTLQTTKAKRKVKEIVGKMGDRQVFKKEVLRLALNTSLVAPVLRSQTETKRCPQKFTYTGRACSRSAWADDRLVGIHHLRQVSLDHDHEGQQQLGVATL